MKIKDIKQPTNYTIYVDLDGVMADLYKKIHELTGHWIINDDNGADAEAWKEVNAYRKAGNKMFEELELLPDAMQLWNYVKRYNPHILTALGKYMTEETDKEKRTWISRNLSGYNNVYTVKFSRMKAEYATPTSILIDDRMRSIRPWKKAGGIGILHKSAADTIHQLKELGL